MSKRKWPDKKKKSLSKKRKKVIEELTDGELRQILRFIEMRKKYKADMRKRKLRGPRRWPQRPRSKR